MEDRTGNEKELKKDKRRERTTEKGQGEGLRKMRERIRTTGKRRGGL